ncbi:MAG: hypothetical protein MJ071_02240 [Oscillospiraceae bacterium]|nr:hypothetical protein [Oscillospiraceae bacterium]
MGLMDGEKIVVCVVFKRKVHWFISDKILWRMDYLRWYDEYHDAYRRTGKNDAVFVKEIGSFGEFSSNRFRITVLDKDTIKDFMKKIPEQEISGGELAYAYARGNQAEQELQKPSLALDFDHRKYWSGLPSEDRFGAYVPHGWASASCTEIIPAKEQYWK